MGDIHGNLLLWFVLSVGFHECVRGQYVFHRSDGIRILVHLLCDIQDLSINQSG